MSYKFDSKPVSGDSYVRCPQVIVDNRLDKTPLVTFHRERILGLDGGAIMREPMSPRIVPFDPAASVDVIDPETGDPTGQTITHGELYALIYSVFIAAEAATTDPEATA